MDLQSALRNLGYSRTGFVDLSTASGVAGDASANDRVALNDLLTSFAAAGGGAAVVPPNARYRIEGGDLIVPSNVTLVGSNWVGDYRPGQNWSQAPSAFIVAPDSTVRLRRNAQLCSTSVIAKGLYDMGVINTSAKAMAAVSAMAGVGVTVGDGTAGDSAGNATGSAVSDNLIVGFEVGVSTDGSSRLRVDGNRIDSHSGIRHSNVYDPADIRNNRMPMIAAAGSFSTRVFKVDNAENNGMGLIRLTISPETTGVSNSDLVSGYKVVVSAVGGVPNASGIWEIVVVDATRIDLVGSTWAGQFTSGGRVNPPIGWRRGAGIYLHNCDGSTVTNNFGNNFTTGIEVSQSSSCMVANNFFEGYGYAHDKNIGLLISNNTARCVFGVEGFSVYTHKIVHDSASLNNIIGHALGSGEKSIWIKQGEVAIDGCLLEGAVYVEDAATRVVIFGGNQKGATVSGSAAALRKVVQIGSKSVGVAHLSGRQIDHYIRRTSDGAEVLTMRLSENRVNMPGLPTVATGLVSGDLWNDAGTVKIVP